MKAKKVSLFGVLGAVALVLSFLESSLLPDIPFMPPGAKLGLSNVVTMLAACFSGLGGAFYITALKVLFAFITRGASAAFMSLSGGVLSTLTVGLLIGHEGKIFSFLGIGILGAVSHNLGQLMAAAIISGTLGIFNYSKYLLVFALITGSLTGAMLLVLMPRLSKVSEKYILRNDKKRS